ncbi:MAG: CHAT domain-containing protein [Pseudomonadota bacterium]
MRYEDFNIRILNKRDDGFDVAVESPAGSANAHITLPDDLRESAAQLNNLSGAFRGEATRKAVFDQPAATASPEEIGSELFRSLFTGNVRRMYDRSYSSLQDPNTGLRIKLHLNLDDPEVSKLAQVPWEYVYEKDTMEYLTLSHQTPLVRYVEVQRPTTKQPLEGRLRILVVMSNPDGVHPLDLDRERQLIENSWAKDPNVRVDFLTAATPDNLRERLINNDYHVLHYMGHGTHDPVTGAGALVLEDDNNEAVLMDASTLGTLLRDAQSIQLVFLNACDTGRVGTEEPFAGVANRLVMAGMPAVLAMQFPISDQAAIDFAKAFYPRLVDGFGVDEATAQGRKAILSGRQGSLEWGTPVLYMRAPDGQLFKTRDPEPAPLDTQTRAAAPAAAGSGSALKGAVGGALAVLSLIVAAFIWIVLSPSSTAFKFESDENRTFVGDTTKVRLLLAKDEVSRSDVAEYGVEIRGASGVTGIEVGETAIVNNAWQVAVSGIETGTYEVIASVETLDQTEPFLFTTNVEVVLDPAVVKAMDDALARIGDKPVSTRDALDGLDDLPESRLGPDAIARVNEQKTLLDALLQTRQRARTLDPKTALLEERIGAFNDWKTEFERVRGFAASEAQDAEAAATLAAADALASRTTADKFVLCASTSPCGGASSFAKSASIHTHVGYTKPTGDAERFQVVYQQDGDTLKTRNFSAKAEAGGSYLRDYSTVRASAGEVRALLYNGDGDLIATAIYTAN